MSLYLTVYNVATFFRKIEIKITQRVQKLVKKIINVGVILVPNESIFMLIEGPILLPGHKQLAAVHIYLPPK